MLELTDFGRKVADHAVSQSEFAAVTIVTLTLPNANVQSAEECDLWHRHGIEIKPLQVLLSILLELSARGQGYITPSELTNIVIPLSGSNAHTKDYANFICWARDSDVDVDKFPNCCVGSNDRRMAREFLLFLG